MQWPRRAIWSRNDPVTVLGASKNAHGQDELDALFAELAARFSDCTSYACELYEAEVRGDTAYIVGLNGKPGTYTLRATQVYRRQDGSWKVAHRHGSAPPESRTAWSCDGNYGAESSDRGEGLSGTSLIAKPELGDVENRTSVVVVL
ncbi:YybH family protein [Aeromicrobium sp.]|uniref:YybH family protein n=1 Tax=Aeromicrobium sp. TaxID=1871063 RepID=UPI003C6EC495